MKWDRLPSDGFPDGFEDAQEIWRAHFAWTKGKGNLLLVKRSDGSWIWINETYRHAVLGEGGAGWATPREAVRNIIAVESGGPPLRQMVATTLRADLVSDTWSLETST